MKLQTIQIEDKTMIVLSKADFDAIMEKAGVLPKMPAKTRNGGYPAREAMNTMIAREIVSRRIKAGWTQRDLAVKAGVSAEQISRIESGRHRPTNETIARIEAAFSADNSRE